MNFNECHAAYLDAVCPDHATGSHLTLKGVARDAALLPLSCVPTLARDNHGYSYPVFVRNGVLYFVGAPSGWSVDSILASFRLGHFTKGGIALDFGQGWYCVNMDMVMEELVAKGVIA